ncbi:hypothetical protein PROFUN_15945 [Planoprotostelium fungivorum]|uniref:Uncharacterized protein n=1 Tax=Planoprotostelium fungivorum TaxID=1890364 RepID=A0A2P6MU51_9EUKA|nr:hypothetical protein PROFUN_15945 [Planoprotostelium fungivorum]
MSIIDLSLRYWFRSIYSVIDYRTRFISPDDSNTTNMNFFSKAESFLQNVASNNNNNSAAQQHQYSEQQQQAPQQGEAERGFALPSFLHGPIDNYVDGFAPEIEPVIVREIGSFQTKTLDFLEGHVLETFQSIISGDFSVFQNLSNVGDVGTVVNLAGHSSVGNFLGNVFGQQQPQQGYPQPGYSQGYGQQGYPQQQQNYDPQYGQRGLPFLPPSGYNSDPVGTANQERGIFDQAMNMVTQYASQQGPIGNMAQELNRLRLDPVQKAREVIPDLRRVLEQILSNSHSPLANGMCRAALTCLKSQLHGQVTSRDISSGFGGQERGIMDPLNGLLSRKLGESLTLVRSHTRIEFQRILGEIEKMLFDHLPAQFKEPLLRVLGAGFLDQGQRGIFGEIEQKIHQIIDRIQKALRDKLMEMINGGHRALENKAWAQVQDVVVTRVRRIAPGVQVQLQD